MRGDVPESVGAAATYRRPASSAEWKRPPVASDAPDLDCVDVRFDNFRVRWDVADPDPHHFDGNRDGVGCES
jgi:hypothetical protein